MVTQANVNNAIYDALGERWYEADDDPIALLRAESRLRNPWIAEVARERLGKVRNRVLDLGCGAGFLSNYLAAEGFDVTGFDASTESLAVAARHDPTRTVRYQRGDARALPYASESFDLVCAMDFLEHVDDPALVVAEASRVLAPGGLFFFHTFNRNRLAWLVVVKGVEWVVRNTPPDLHVLRLFVKPEELTAMCNASGLDVREVRGAAPRVFSGAFFKMLTTGVVPKDFCFDFVRSTAVGYTGFAEKG